LEQSALQAERHKPDAETGPLASRHETDIAELETSGSLRASREPVEESGPMAERYTSDETFEASSPYQLGPQHGREVVGPEPGLPLPPLPVPGYVLNWVLVVVRTPEGSGVELQQRFELAGHLRIGRHGAIDLKLLDPKVSRQHADIDVEGTTCRITDLGSSNGTYVNGRRISEPTELKHGDAIKIGDSYFVVEHRVE
jgi:hypothetical protein